nr:MAG TPA: hypothetical protein [Caudoviricetes sp.]
MLRIFALKGGHIWRLEQDRNRSYFCVYFN